MGDLRQRIAESCYANTNIKADEVFVSDGAKCDIARLQIMFGSGVTSGGPGPVVPRLCRYLCDVRANRRGR